MIPGQD